MKVLNLMTINITNTKVFTYLNNLQANGVRITKNALYYNSWHIT